MTLKAITNCRVSTSEQLENNSLNRQLTSVEQAAQKLGAVIPNDGRWSGNVSSKAGTNVTRKDLLEMLAYCKKNKDVKFAIFDEYDRYMRSVNEGPYFEVCFQQLGVKVWYASESDTFNGDDAMAKFMRTMSGFKAEGSNEERQRKSVSGHKKAIAEGRYTFPPLPGYIKGDKPGVHKIDHINGKLWQQALKDVASKVYTPSEAMKKLNSSKFMRGKFPMKIDKFLHFIQNPYYCGVIEVGKQINTRCEKGQHRPLITKEEHESILEVINGRPVRNILKLQYNPEFPMSKILMHDCVVGAKFTGSFQSNGHGKKYPKYRCRKCDKQYHREFIHNNISNVLEKFEYNDTQRNEFIKALTTVWTQKQQHNLSQIKDTQKRLDSFRDEKSRLIRVLANANCQLIPDIEDEVVKVKQEIEHLEQALSHSNEIQEDLVEFVKFGLEYTNYLKLDWWQLNQEDRFQCQQLLFPEGIIVNKLGKVSTNQIIPLYRLISTKKELDFDSSSLLVELEGIAPSSMKN